MKPIPTTLRGVTFRSRLEARVSLFLDEWNIEWSYEHEGYELSDGTRYLPDFWLPEISTYLEVKGAHGEGLDKVRRFAHDLYGADADLIPDPFDPLGPGISHMWHPEHLVLAAEFGQFQGYHDFLKVAEAFSGIEVSFSECQRCFHMQWAIPGVYRCRDCGEDFHPSQLKSGITVNLFPPLPRLPQWMPTR